MISQKVSGGHGEVYLLLHNIRSTHNVGSIFRTADATGVKKIYLSGYTPAPIDRFGRERSDISKASLGAEKFVNWESVGDPLILIKTLKEEGVHIFGLEQDENSVDYRKMKKGERNLIILGEEVNGIETDLLELCDEIVEIPMLGKKESLNVSVATGVLLYSLI
jgi:23S rRNA (guanosine2251-2'-O)-methyltransferase